MATALGDEQEGLEEVYVSKEPPRSQQQIVTGAQSKAGSTGAATIASTSEADKTAEQLSPGRASPRSGCTIPGPVSMVLHNGFHCMLDTLCPSMQ